MDGCTVLMPVHLTLTVLHLLVFSSWTFCIWTWHFVQYSKGWYSIIYDWRVAAEVLHSKVKQKLFTEKIPVDKISKWYHPLNTASNRKGNSRKEDKQTCPTDHRWKITKHKYGQMKVIVLNLNWMNLIRNKDVVSHQNQKYMVYPFLHKYCMLCNHSLASLNCLCYNKCISITSLVYKRIAFINNLHRLWFKKFSKVTVEWSLVEHQGT